MDILVGLAALFGIFAGILAVPTIAEWLWKWIWENASKVATFLGVLFFIPAVFWVRDTLAPLLDIERGTVGIALIVGGFFASGLLAKWMDRRHNEKVRKTLQKFMEWTGSRHK